MTSEELKLWRQVNGYSQNQLGKVLGVTNICISRWERGVRKIPTFLHLALRCLELQGGELLKGQTKKKKESDKRGKRYIQKG